MNIKYPLIVIFILFHLITLSAMDLKNWKTVKNSAALKVNKVYDTNNELELYFDLNDKNLQAIFEYKLQKPVDLSDSHFILVSLFVPAEIFDNTLMFFITVKLWGADNKFVKYKTISLRDGDNKIKIDFTSNKWSLKDNTDYNYILDRDILKEIVKYQIILTSSHPVCGKVVLKNWEVQGKLTKYELKKLQKNIELNTWNFMRFINIIFPKSHGYYGIFSKNDELNEENNFSISDTFSLLTLKHKFDIEKTTDAVKIVKQENKYELFFDLKSGGYLHGAFNLIFDNLQDFSKYEKVCLVLEVPEDIKDNEVECRIVLNNGKWKAEQSKPIKLKSGKNVIYFNLKNGDWSQDWGKTYGFISALFLKNIKRIVIDFHANKKINSKIILRKIYIIKKGKNK